MKPFNLKPFHCGQTIHRNTWNHSLKITHTHTHTHIYIYICIYHISIKWPARVDMPFNQITYNNLTLSVRGNLRIVAKNGVFHTSQISRTGATLPGAVKCLTRIFHFWWGGGAITPLTGMQSAYSKHHQLSIKAFCIDLFSSYLFI